jgi:hypothetical protein
VASRPARTTVDLSEYPDLVVMYLGMRVEEPRGLETMQILQPQIQAAVEEGPDGLLLHEQVIYSTDPPHYGMRQYWRDFDALEAWSNALPHKRWWRDYLRDRRYLVLARDVLPARRVRVRLRRCRRAARAHRLRPHAAGRGADALGPFSRRPVGGPTCNPQRSLARITRTEAETASAPGGR